MIAFYIPGGIPVYLFSLFLAVGAFLGLTWVVMRAEAGQASELVEAGLWTLVGSLIGGRIVYVFFAWPYFREHPLEAFQIYLGGMAWSGVMLGGLLAGVIYAILNQRSVGNLLDALAPLPVVLAITGWIGCLVDGCGYGEIAPWVGVPMPDELGSLTARWPVQVFAALATLAAFWLIDRLPPTARSGLRAGLLVLVLALIQLGAALFAVPGQTWRGLPVDAWAALALAGLAMLALGIVFRSGQRNHKQ